MNNILFKSLALAVIGTSVPCTAASAYQINHKNITTLKNQKNKKNKVGFENNNPVFVRNQHDSQGADTVTLSDVNGSGFVLNYTLSAATLAYFYPAIGSYVQPGDALYQLLSTGTAWNPANHFWKPLEGENPFFTVLNDHMYFRYLSAFKTNLEQQFYWTNDLQPATYDMKILQQAMQTGSGMGIRVKVGWDGEFTTDFEIASYVIPNHYSPAAIKNGSDSVFGNLNEPYNVLKVNISATSCIAIHNHYSAFSAFLPWLLNKQGEGYAASDKLNLFINDKAKGFKYKTDGINPSVADYWTTANYDDAIIAMKESFLDIISSANANLSTKGITLTFVRNEAGQIKITVQPQLPPYRTAYYNASKFFETSQYDFVFLSAQDMVALRLASFRYLTDSGQYTTTAWENAKDWLFGYGGHWSDGGVVHPFAEGKTVNNQGAWALALQKFYWAYADQSMAQWIIQNRGGVLELQNPDNPEQSKIVIYGQNAIPSHLLDHAISN